MSSSASSLEFGSANKGLVLPYVTSAQNVTGAVNGTLIFDSTDKKVKLLAKNQWVDYTQDDTGTVDLSIQSSKTENLDARTVIGVLGSADKTPGILVLSDKDKAMILPKVASPHLNIIKPAAGMIVYDTTAHQLAVYNGSVWSFWKPQ